MYVRLHFIYLAPDTHRQIAQSLVIKLQQVLSSDNTGLHGCLPHVNATLKKLLLTCNAACMVQSSSSSSVNMSFDKAQQIALGKKMELQSRFTSTVKKTGRKRKNTL